MHAHGTPNRHGESQWNLENRFTGWYNIQLSSKGEIEAAEGGRLIHEAGYTFGEGACWNRNEQCGSFRLFWWPVGLCWGVGVRAGSLPLLWVFFKRDRSCCAVLLLFQRGVGDEGQSHLTVIFGYY